MYTVKLETKIFETGQKLVPVVKEYTAPNLKSVFAILDAISDQYQPYSFTVVIERTLWPK